MNTRILALDIAGTPFKWMSYEEAACKIISNKISWSLGEENSILLRGGIQNSGIQSEIVVPPIIALARSEGMVKHMGAISLGRDNRPLFVRDFNQCSYCGDDRHKLTRDHIIPTSRGGKDIWENVTSACIDCNSRKSAKTPEEAKMKLRLQPYAPNRFEAFLLSGRGILIDQAQYLKSRISPRTRIC